MAHFETRSAVNKDGSIPRMGENTNEDIGGVMDWQNVGEETAADVIRPPLGPVSRMLDNVTMGRVEEAPRINYPMNAKSTGGVVGKPVYATSPDGYSKKVSLNYDGGINNGASTVNLSAKFKSPQKNQEHIPKEGFNQYE